MDEQLFDDAARAIGAAMSRRGALIGLAALLPLGAAAGKRRDERPHSDKKKKKKKTCKPGNCPDGCCKGKRCREGTSVDACGTGGAACAECGSGQVCFGGACVAECTAATCPGCCDPLTNACQPGNVAGACGTLGQACRTCAGGQVCAGGTCETACSAANCGGCCNAANRCESGASAESCGSGGAACAPCSDDAPCCTGGTCRARRWTSGTTFGSGPGAGLGQFDAPMGVAVTASRGTVLVADTANDRISAWRGVGEDPVAWTPQVAFGAPGSGPDQFGAAEGVAIAPDGRTAWVADAENDRVTVWIRPDGESVLWQEDAAFGVPGSALGQFDAPRDVAISTDLLTAWVADSGNNRVQVWTRPNAGSTAWTAQTAFGIGPDSGDGQFDTPSGVAVSADGLSVVVADERNNRVSAWTRPNAGSTAWNYQAAFGTAGSGPADLLRPRGVALSEDGATAWVADTGNNRVAIWTRPNAGSAAWSNAGTYGGFGTSPNQFVSPSGIVVDDSGRMAWIADTGNDRITVWAETCP